MMPLIYSETTDLVYKPSGSFKVSARDFANILASSRYLFLCSEDISLAGFFGLICRSSI